jgi:hypothetical protein
MTGPERRAGVPGSIVRASTTSRARSETNLAVARYIAPQSEPTELSSQRRAGMVSPDATSESL